VSCPHKEKGEGIYCFTTLMEGVAFSEHLIKELKQKGTKVILHCSMFQ